MPNNETLKPLEGSFKIQLTMQSDWHIGSGTGRPGEVDRLVRRDEDGLPFIPAKTLTGIWRDGCERVALGLDGGEIKTEIKEVEGEEKEIVIGWSAWIPFLFGDQAGQLDEDRPNLSEEEKKRRNEKLALPRPAIVSVRSGHFPDSLRDAIKGQPAVQDAVTFVKPGISIDPRSGRAREDHLRFEEMARGGVTLKAEASIDFSSYENVSDGQKKIVTALLLAGAKLVERIGAKRRRGAGQCEMKIGNFDVSPWIETLETDNPPLPPSPKAPEQFSLQTQEAGDEWACARLNLTAKTPLIISEQTIGNLVKTLDYIPGTYLLPILRRKLGDQLNCDINSAIFSGQLLVTNATVAVDGKPGRPVPFALFHEKVGGGLKLGRGVYNRLREDAEGKPQLKGHRSGYIGLSPAKTDELPAYKTAALEVEPHNVVEDKYQRPNEAVGGVYSYEVIPQGTTLCAQLRVRKSLLNNPEDDWCAALTDDCKIGRSKKDDYGLVHLQASKAECETLKPALTDELTVWLLSDVLLRDERLRPTASVQRFAKVLGEKLGVTLTVRQPANPKLMSALSRTHRTDSWHVGWGLPRPSLVGLAAGTCVVFVCEAGKAIDIGKLNDIASEGIGERRAEGYGRLCFNDPLLVTEAKDRKRGIDAKEQQKWPKSPVEKDDSAFDYAHLIEKEALRREIKRAAMRQAAKEEGRAEALGIKLNARKESVPPMSQLGALRSAIGLIRSTTDIARFTTEDENKKAWLDNLERKEKNSSTRKWPEGSISKIRKLVKAPRQVWDLLKINFEDYLLTATAGKEEERKREKEVKDVLWAEAVRTLVDACIRVQKRATERTDNSKKGDESNGAQN